MKQANCLFCCHTVGWAPAHQNVRLTINEVNDTIRSGAGVLRSAVQPRSLSEALPTLQHHIVCKGLKS
ncbi:MAG: hypothetical protein ACRCYY_13520 [Trueperaceae bacterium]